MARMLKGFNDTHLPELDKRIPATIITGAPGSGKTTLLNHILGSGGKRFAVIQQNESGEVRIHRSIAASHSSAPEKIVTLFQGNQSRTIRLDLVDMISELVTKKSGKFDHILIETTGLTDLRPVIETFISDLLLPVPKYVKLDGVVTVVDSKNVMQHLDIVKARYLGHEIVEQVAFAADRIIMNKIDLVTEGELETVIRRIKHITGMAQIKQAKDCSIDMDVLDIGQWDLHRIVSLFDADQQSAQQELEGHQQNHQDLVTTVRIVCEGKAKIKKVAGWLTELTTGRGGEDMCRIKGVLSMTDSNQRYALEVLCSFHQNGNKGIPSTLDGCKSKEWGPEEKRINKLMFIGRNLNKAALRKGFKRCLV